MALKRRAPVPTTGLGGFARLVPDVTRTDFSRVRAILRAAQKFKASYIEIVSGFRAPKYQLMLRKKGHEVARDSEHPRGRNKARVFASVGIRRANAEYLRTVILAAARGTTRNRASPMFTDSDAMVALKPEQPMGLHHEPVHQAA